MVVNEGGVSGGVAVPQVLQSIPFNGLNRSGSGTCAALFIFLSKVQS